MTIINIHTNCIPHPTYMTSIFIEHKPPSTQIVMSSATQMVAPPNDQQPMGLATSGVHMIDC